MIDKVSDTYKDRLRIALANANLKEADLSRLLGISSAAVNKWKCPPNGHKDILCKILNVSWDWLAYGLGDNPIWKKTIPNDPTTQILQNIDKKINEIIEVQHGSQSKFLGISQTGFKIKEQVEILEFDQKKEHESMQKSMDLLLKVVEQQSHQIEELKVMVSHLLKAGTHQVAEHIPHGPVNKPRKFNPV